MVDTEETTKSEDEKPKRARRVSAKASAKASAKPSAKATASKSMVDEPKAKAKAPAKKRTIRRKGAAAAEAAPVAAVADAPVATANATRPLPRLKELHINTVGPALIKEFNYTSPMQVPTIEKIIVNIGLGEALTNPRALENATNDITKITGQRPITNRARKSIANYKLREGMPVG